MNLNIPNTEVKEVIMKKPNLQGSNATRNGLHFAQLTPEKQQRNKFQNSHSIPSGVTYKSQSEELRTMQIETALRNKKMTMLVPLFKDRNGAS